jgi:hypothetical protein
MKPEPDIYNSSNNNVKRSPVKKGQGDWVDKLGKDFDKNVYQGDYDKVAYGRFNVDKSFKEYVEMRDADLLEEGKKKKKKWIQDAIKHPGRCADMGSPDCPKGSPQYNLAKRFKKGGDLYAGKNKNKKKD